MRTCEATIDLRYPRSRDRVRAGFQPHWRTVFVYVCPGCGAACRVYASSFSGTHATPAVGGIRCGALLPEAAPVGAEEGGAG
jgi:hypothetical protein